MNESSIYGTNYADRVHTEISQEKFRDIMMTHFLNYVSMFHLDIRVVYLPGGDVMSWSLNFEVWH